MIGGPESERQERASGNPPQRARKPIIVRVYRALTRQINKQRRKPQPAQTQHQINERMMAVWTGRVGWFTLALVLVGMISAVIFWRQLSVMQGQLDEMRLDARAWLAPKDIDRPPGFFMHPDPPYNAATIAFNFTNTGKEPATLVNRLIGYKFIDNAWNRAQIGSKIGEILGNRACKDFSANPAGDTVFPGDQQRFVFALTADEAKIVLGGGHYLLVGGCLVYQTISEIHRTEICRILDPIDPNVSPGESGFRTIICPIHNHAN